MKNKLMSLVAKPSKQSIDTISTVLITVIGVLLVIMVIMAIAIKQESGAIDGTAIPLVAAVMNSTITAIGIFVAVLVLRFNYKNQITPIRVEWFKEQLATALKISSHVEEVATKLKLCVGGYKKGALKDIEKQGRKKEVNESLIEIMRYVMQKAIVSNLEVKSRIIDYVNATVKALEKLEDSEKPLELIADEFERTVVEHGKVLSAISKWIGAETISNEIFGLMTGISHQESEIAKSEQITNGLST